MWEVWINNLSEVTEESAGFIEKQMYDWLKRTFTEVFMKGKDTLNKGTNIKHCRDCRFLVLPDYDTMMRGSGNEPRKCAHGGWERPSEVACSKFEE